PFSCPHNSEARSEGGMAAQFTQIKACVARLDRYGIDDPSQFLFVLPESLFRLLQVVNVGIRAIPCDDMAQRIAQRLGAEEEPAIGAVATSPSGFDLTRLPRSGECLPRVHHPPEIVGMHGDVPSPAVGL